MLRVKLFGSGRLLDGNAEIRLPSRTWTVPLLANLVLHRGETMARWRLAFTVWPDETEAAALQNLRRNLHLLTKALPRAPKGVPWIVADAENIAWNGAARFELDLEEFERLRADAATLEQAVTLYEGDLLEDIYDDWIAAERERLRRLYFADLTTLILGNRSRRSFAAATMYAQLLLSADPWREDAIRHLMAIRYEAGDAAGALSEFDRFASALRTEMDVDPMPETVSLRDAIASGVAIPTALGAPEAAQRTRVPFGVPLVGRDVELERLRAHWQRAARGQGGILLVRGAAGIGKSRLVSELALLAESEGGRVIEGTTGTPENGPYAPIAAALRQAIPLVAASGLAAPLLAAVAELVPELRSRRADLPMVMKLDETSERWRLFDALAQLVAALAKPRPLLLILEDLHWAGVATIDMVSMLAQRAPGNSVAIVGTYRDEEVARDHPLRALERAAPGAAHPVRLSLASLGRASVDELVEAIAPADSTLRKAAPSIFERSEGNPLFVTEMLRDALRDGSDRFVIPASIQAMISAKVERLEPATRAVAEVAAVVGTGFTADLVREVAGIPEAEMLRAIDELLDRHLVRESAERGRYDYAFTHHLVHAAIYDAVPDAARVRRHHRIARILDESSADVVGDRAREIALHFERGSDPQAAAAYYAIAASRAAQLFANAEARDLVDHALALKPESDPVRFDLLLLRNRMSVRLGDAEASELVELDRVASRLGDDAICTALAQRIDVASRRHDLAAETEAIESLERRARGRQDERWVAAALEALARNAVRRFDSDRALDAALDAGARYGALGDTGGSARAAAIAAMAFANLGQAVDADRSAQEARALAERIGDAEVQLRVLRDMANVAQERMEYARVAEIGRSTLDLCRLTGDRRAEADCNGLIGTALFALWHVDDALVHLRAAIALFDSLRSPRVAVALNNFACLLTDLGQFSEAEHALTRGLAVASANGFTDGVLLTVVNLIDAAWQRGDVAAMRAAADRFGDAPQMPETRYPAHVALSLGRLYRCEGATAASVAALDEALAGFRKFDRPGDEIDVLDDLALTYLAGGQLEEAVAVLERGDRIGAAQTAAFTLQYPIRHYWIAAFVRHAGGEAPAATSALRRAHSMYLERRAQIGDEGARASFEAIGFHRALCAAIGHDEWPRLGCRCAVAFAVCYD
jgi:DNA-binding SARP family transcriptional activator/tetratricopeptide (TPR) repeat protein